MDENTNSSNKVTRLSLNLRTRQARLTLIVLITTIYLVTFVPFYHAFGGGVLAFSVLPVALAGLLYGRGAGVAASLLTFPLNTLLLNFVGYQSGGWDVIFRAGGLPGTFVIVVIGLGAGYLHDLYERSERELRERAVASEALKQNEKKYREQFNAAERQVQEMALLDEVRTALARELDLADLFRTVVEGSARTFGYTQVSLYLLLDQTLHLQHQVGYERVIAEVPITKGITGRVARTGVPLFIPNVHQAPEFIGAIEGIVSEICVPLFQQRKVVGILNVESTQGITLTESDLRLMLALSDHINIALARARVYTALRESERRYRELVDYAGDIIYKIVPSGHFTFVNPTTVRITGYSEEELVGKNYIELIQPEFQKRVSHFYRKQFAGKIQSTYLEFPITTKEGQAIWIGQNVRLILGESGQRVIGFHAVARDITKQRIAEEALTRQNDYLSALHTIALDLLNRREIDDLLQSIVERAVDLLDSPYVEIKLLEENYLVTRAFTKNQPFLLGYRAGRNDSPLSWQACDTKRPAQVDNYAAWPEHRSLYDVLRLRAVLCVPILAGEVCIGVLDLSRDQVGHSFSSEEIQIATLFAEMLALALDNARLYSATQEELRVRRRVEDELNTRERHLRLLNEITQTAISAQDLSALLQTFADRLGELLDADGCFITLWDEANQRTVPAATFGNWRDTYSRTQSEASELTMTESVLGAGHALVIEDTYNTSDPSPRIAMQYPPGCLLGLPFIAGEQKLGAALISFPQGHRLTDAEIKRGENAAAQIALAISKTRLFAEVQRLARTDDLTGVSNRRHLFELGELEFRRARRLHHSLSAIMFDLDHFKEVNDTYGHIVGDQALRAVADDCQMTIRGIDIIGRYGGDEFAVLLPETLLAEAQIVAERIRQRMAATPLDTTRGPLNITISLGVAEVDAKISNVGTLLDRADSALYQAKQNGRNRVAVFGK